MNKAMEQLLIGFLAKGVPYSYQVLQDAAELDKVLMKHIDGKVYFEVEEQLNAVLAQYEEEAFLYGFKMGFQIANDCIR